MFAPKTTQIAKPAGQAITRHLEGSILETSYTGHVGPEILETVLAYTPEILTEVKGARWLVDLSKSTSNDASARVPGLAILKSFRELGGVEFAVVLSSGPLRMIFGAVAFAAGMPVKFFDRHPDALRHLRAGALPG
jgi:hypothetical protein